MKKELEVKKADIEKFNNEILKYKDEKNDAEFKLEAR